MNIVLYTSDFEPITVLNLPVWLLEQLEQVGQVRVAVMEPVKLQAAPELQDTIPELKTVAIRCEKLRWRDGSLKPILITDDEELAMILKPEWLPGQRASINGYKQAIRTLTDQLVRALRK